jgi:hypothetical protein
VLVEVAEEPELLPDPVGKVIPVLDEEPESDEADAETDEVAPLLSGLSQKGSNKIQHKNNSDTYCDEDAEGGQFGSSRPSRRPQLAEAVGDA